MSKSVMDTFQAFLAGQGLRMTGQRELIASIFFRNKGHVSAEELHGQVREVSTGIGFATVYRTIKLLSDAGLARGMNFGDGFMRYEPATHKEHHDHLICTRCGSIVEFENDRIEELQKAVASRHGFSITDHKLELYGTCGACRG